MPKKEEWKLKKHRKIPVVVGSYVIATSGQRLLAFFCPFCRRWHSHSPHPGHRCDHCVNVVVDGRCIPKKENSPFAKCGGYFLETINTAPLPEGWKIDANQQDS